MKNSLLLAGFFFVATNLHFVDLVINRATLKSLNPKQTPLQLSKMRYASQRFFFVNENNRLKEKEKKQCKCYRINDTMYIEPLHA